MPDSMDAIQFTQRAKKDPQLREFLEEVAEEVGKQVSVEKPETFAVAGIDLLFGVAAYALYRFVKDYLDSKTLKRQAEVIKMLIEAGFPLELAKTTVVALLKRIAKRTADDPALKKAFDLIGKAD